MQATTRRFSLLDFMVFIAAAAVGMAIAVGLWKSPSMEVFLMTRPYPKSIHDLSSSLFYLLNYLKLLSSMAAPGAAAICLLAFRRPRPETRQLVDQPGIAACLAITIVMLISVAHSLWQGYKLGWFDRIDIELTRLNILVYAFDDSLRPAGLAVCAVWIIAVIGRRWLPEPNWLDRTGRCLGVFWILFTILMVVEGPV